VEDYAFLYICVQAQRTHTQKRTSADLRDRAPCSIQITRFGVTADGYPGDHTAGYIGGYVRRIDQRR
jgi:hypothetical protein